MEFFFPVCCREGIAIHADVGRWEEEELKKSSVVVVRIGTWALREAKLSQRLAGPSGKRQAGRDEAQKKGGLRLTKVRNDHPNL